MSSGRWGRLLCLVAVAAVALARPVEASPLDDPVLTSAVTVTASPSPSYFTQTVTLTADATFGPNQTAVPTGDVQFSVDGVALGTDAVDKDGEATLAVANFPVSDQPQTVEAVYVPMSGTGPPVMAGSSDTVSHTHTKAPTRVALSSSDADSVHRQALTLTAAVNINGGGGAAVPTGTVRLLDGGTELGTAALPASGVVTFNVSDLALGTHSLVAEYGGTSGYAGSSSPALTQTVSMGTPTMAVTSAPNPSFAGQAVVLTATVAAGSGEPVPTGTVTFTHGGDTLGTATLDGTGRADLSTAAIPAPGGQVTADYSGDQSYVPISRTASQTVVKAGTDLTLAGPSDPASGTLRFTASVTPTDGSLTPRGTVVFTRGETTLGSVALDDTGRAVLTTTLPIGRSVVRATYGGSSQHHGSDASDTVVVMTTRPSSRPDLGTTVTFGDAVREVDDCRTDVDAFGATYGNSKITVATGIECGTNPRNDPAWAGPEAGTFVIWGIDTNGGGDVEYVVGGVGTPDGLVGGVLRAVDLQPLCPANLSWDGAHVYKATFPASCIKSPSSFRMGAALFFDDSGTDTNCDDCPFDSAPDNDTVLSSRIAPASSSGGGGATLVEVKVKDTSVLEGDSGRVRMKYVVKLLDPSKRTVKVKWHTKDGTARAGRDYRAVSGVIEFEPGQVKKVVKVVVFGDRKREPGETVIVRLSSPVNAAIADAKGVGKIRNDD